MASQSLHKNRMGMNYRVVQAYGEPDCTIINETIGKSIVVKDVSEGLVRRGWYTWIHENKLAQDAFPFLNHSEREFIISGITPTEWDLMFNGDKDE